MENKKRNLIVIALSIGFLCIAVGSTFAYLTVTAGATTNVFTFLEPMVLVKVVETDPQDMNLDPEYVNFGENQKRVKLENPNSPLEGFFVADTVNRVMFVPMFKDESYGIEGRFQDFEEPIDNKMSLGVITLLFTPDWESKWFFKDGYFYYKSILKAGEKTPVLLKGVTVNQGYGYSGTDDLRIEVLADAIETDPSLALTGWNLILDETGLHE